MKIDDLFYATDSNDKDFPTELLGKIHAKRKDDFERFKAFVLNAVNEMDKITVKGRVTTAKVKELLGVV